MIVLLILVTGSASFLLSELNKGGGRQARNITTATQMSDIRRALIGYAQTFSGCLPCPSTSATVGTAPPSCITAASRRGFLPWDTLSLGALDDWGRRLRYVVDQNHVNTCNYMVATTSIMVRTRDTTGVLVPVASNLVAVVISHGANGYGARTETGTAVPNPPPLNSDEDMNRTTTTDFRQRNASDDTAITGGPFDDLVGWIDRQTLRDAVDAAIGGLPP